jgi:hypothetical protein
MAGPNLIRDSVCPFCLSGLPAAALLIATTFGWATVQCPACGAYRIEGVAGDLLEHWEISDERRAGMAFALRRMTDKPELPLLTRHVVKSLIESAELPAPDSLLDIAVLWFGEHSKRAGQEFYVTYPTFRTVFGAVDGPAFAFVTDAMLQSGFKGKRAPDHRKQMSQNRTTSSI